MFENWLSQGEKLLPYIWAEYWSEYNSFLNDFNTERFYIVDKSCQFFIGPDLETVTIEKKSISMLGRNFFPCSHKQSVHLFQAKIKIRHHVVNTQVTTARGCQPCLTTMLLGFQVLPMPLEWQISLHTCLEVKKWFAYSLPLYPGLGCEITSCELKYITLKQPMIRKISSL